MKLSGIDALQKKLRKNATLADVKFIVKSNGASMTSNSQRLAPVDSGYLKRNILQEVSSDGLESTTEPKNVDYAGYVENGTRFQTAQPFVKPAFDVQKKVFLNDMERLTK